MTRFVLTVLGLGLVLLALAGATPAAALVTLHYSPSDTTVAPGDTLWVSVMIDDVLDLRTFEAYLEYDPAILERTDAGPGQLFEDAGCFIYTDCEEDVLGQLHVYAITFGPDCWVSGPGELYRLQFFASALGVSDVIATEVIIYDPEGAPMEDEVILPDAQILVTDVIPGVPPTLPGAHLDLYPNPFNPRVTLSFATPVPASARLLVYDLRGQQVATVWSGQTGGDALSVSWDGTDAGGRALPSGTYCFRLESATGVVAVREGVLVR